MGNVDAYLPRGIFESRKLLNSAHEMDICTNCGAYSPDGLEPAHSNLSEHGKGKGVKAHDCFFAALCALCHRWLDNQLGAGKDPSGLWTTSPADKREMFLRAMHRTWLAIWRLGKVRVA